MADGQVPWREATSTTMRPGHFAGASIDEKRRLLGVVPCAGLAKWTTDEQLDSVLTKARDQAFANLHGLSRKVRPTQEQDALAVNGG